MSDIRLKALKEQYAELEKKYQELEQGYQEMENKYNKEYKAASHHLFRKVDLRKALTEIANTDSDSKANAENLILKAKLALAHYEMEEFKFMIEQERK